MGEYIAATKAAEQLVNKLCKIFIYIPFDRVIEREAEVGKSAPRSRRQLQAGGGEMPGETPATEESGFV